MKFPLRQISLFFCHFFSLWFEYSRLQRVHWIQLVYLFNYQVTPYHMDQNSRILGVKQKIKDVTNIFQVKELHKNMYGFFKLSQQSHRL